MVHKNSTMLWLIGVGVAAFLAAVWFLGGFEGGPVTKTAPTNTRVMFGHIDGAGPTNVYGFQWTRPEMGTGRGYTWGFKYVLKNSAGNVVAQSDDTKDTAVPLPVPYTRGEYTFEVSAYNQFGQGPISFSSGKVDIPEIASFASNWVDGDLPYYSPVLVLKEGVASSISYSCVVSKTGQYMNACNGQGVVRDKGLTSDDGGKTWNAGMCPALNPPEPTGIQRGDQFVWEFTVRGPWGAFNQTYDDTIPGGSPSDIGGVGFTDNLPAGMISYYLG